MTSSPTADAPPLAFLETGPDDGPALLLAHGAGAPMDSGFMTAFAEALSAEGLAAIRFEFPYMRKRRADGSKRPPDRMPKLEAEFREAYARASERRASVFIGGKSMGGRAASMIADDLKPAGLVCLGYPFHPPGKPENLRTAHLEALETPALFVQGERDPFGKRDEVPAYSLSSAIEIAWSPDGDHDLKPRKASGLTHEETIRAAAAHVAGFMRA